MTDEELIARLRMVTGFIRFETGDRVAASACLSEEAAARIEALVKERNIAQHQARMRKAFIEEARDERDRAEARAERLEAAMIQMRDDRTGFRHAVHFRRFITAALTPTPVADSPPADPAIKALDELARLGQDFDTDAGASVIQGLCEAIVSRRDTSEVAE